MIAGRLDRGLSSFFYAVCVARRESTDLAFRVFGIHRFVRTGRCKVFDPDSDGEVLHCLHCIV
jgi:hypothetical protein